MVTIFMTNHDCLHLFRKTLIQYLRFMQISKISVTFGGIRWSSVEPCLHNISRISFFVLRIPFFKAFWSVDLSHDRGFKFFRLMLKF